MSVPTITRALLRQAIGRALSMPFYKYYGTDEHVSDSLASANGYFFDTNLTQPDHYWEGSWTLFTGTADTAASSNLLTGEAREIVSFRSSDCRVQLDRGTGTAPASGDQFEIMSGWSPFEIHDAINRAIESAFPHFFDTVEDTTITFSENTLTYALTGLAVRPWKLMAVYLGKPGSASFGIAQTGGASSITASATHDLSAVEAGWAVSIYGGTNAGENRTISTADNLTKVIATSTPWTATPDSTSKYMIWDPSDQEEDWHRIISVRTDAKDWPSTLYFPEKHDDYLGHSLKLVYLAKPSQLTTDTATTTVPEEYVRLKALSFLYSARIGNNRYDRARYSQMAQDMAQQAELYKRSNMWQPTPGTVWGAGEPATQTSYVAVDGNPLDW